MNIEDAINLISSGKNLTFGEAEVVMGIVMGGQVSSPKIVALLTALRIKGESPDELAGFATAMRKHCQVIRPNVSGTLVDTCGTGGDHIKTFNTSTIAAIIVAGAGGCVAKHGNRSVTSKCGSADLMEGFGVNLSAEPKIVENCIAKIGLGFMFAPIFHPAMKYATEARRQIGTKTVFNLLGPLTNPASAKAQLVGVYHPSLTEKICTVLKKLGVERAYVVHGLIGVDEISIIGKTKLSELNQNKIHTYEIYPKLFGVNATTKVEDIVCGDLSQSLKISIQILNGVKGPKTDMAVLNAAAVLVLCERVKTIEEGVEVAYDAVVSGRALNKLRFLVKESGGDLAKLEEVENEFHKGSC
ncbi:MAG: anthranilate phosphoribosyltransferase [Candidatus Bathyarchaeota archaeon]